MGTAEFLVIALGLAMDAFAVSITIGLSEKRLSIAKIIAPGIWFGFFQALMPAVGYFAGVNFQSAIKGVDHWVAFLLLAIIGGKMAIEGMKNKGGGGEGQGYPSAKKLFALSVATSIDALAVGVTLAFLGADILNASLVIGAVTFCISAFGVAIGNRAGESLRARAEVFGGVALVALGAKILLEHLFFSS
ncbi:MAG: manganese efflux pump MntP family protein [Eubacteriaceae bacterium]|jgi:putative Mn2+ efflux pump MntP|nr:manganese efflux pump MntP family protein [Eubacteriaceae bacterium]